jgi:hypothetical protein
MTQTFSWYGKKGLFPGMAEKTVLDDLTWTCNSCGAVNSSFVDGGLVRWTCGGCERQRRPNYDATHFGTHPYTSLTTKYASGEWMELPVGTVVELAHLPGERFVVLEQMRSGDAKGRVTLQREDCKGKPVILFPNPNVVKVVDHLDD